MVRRMRVPFLACCLVVATPALADKPPPLGVPWNGRSAPVAPSSKPGPVESERPTPVPAPRNGFGFNEPDLPAPGERAASSGTGFVVAEGRVLTNRPVVPDLRRAVAR